jgi:hypothetical protein
VADWRDGDGIRIRMVLASVSEVFCRPSSGVEGTRGHREYQGS